MASPAFNDNAVACYPAIVARLEQVEGVKKVLPAEDLSALTGQRKQMPLDGAVFVVIDSIEPLTEAGEGKNQKYEIGISFIYTRTHVDPTRVKTDGDVFKTWTAIARAFLGFDPVDANGKHLTITPFKASRGLSFNYENGFAYYPLRFVTQIALTSAD